MRCLKKTTIPEVLAKNSADWLAEYQADPQSHTKKYRYRKSEIKNALREETGWKCVYCESRIGHNTPGDVEHKIPSSKNPSLHFDWNNLTIACTECNRRKNDYYDIDTAFLDPYSDPVEDLLIHHGPFVSWRVGDERAEITVRTLELNSMRDRAPLIQQKIDLLEKACNLLELIHKSENEMLKVLRFDELGRMQAAQSEYSASVRAFVERTLSTPQ